MLSTPTATNNARRLEQANAALMQRVDALAAQNQQLAAATDAATPEATDLTQVQGFVKAFSRASRLAAWGASAGLFKPLANTKMGDKIGLPPGASADKQIHLWGSTSLHSGSQLQLGPPLSEEG